MSVLLYSTLTLTIVLTSRLQDSVVQILSLESSLAGLEPNDNSHEMCLFTRFHTVQTSCSAIMELLFIYPSS